MAPASPAESVDIARKYAWREKEVPRVETDVLPDA